MISGAKVKKQPSDSKHVLADGLHLEEREYCVTVGQTIALTLVYPCWPLSQDRLEWSPEKCIHVSPAAKKMLPL